MSWAPLRGIASGNALIGPPKKWFLVRQQSDARVVVVGGSEQLIAGFGFVVAVDTVDVHDADRLAVRSTEANAVAWLHLVCQFRTHIQHDR